MLFAKIVVWWVVLSCTLGPLMTWLFFYGAREDDARERALQENARRRRRAPRAITYRPVPQLTYHRRRAVHFR